MYVASELQYTHNIIDIMYSIRIYNGIKVAVYQLYCVYTNRITRADSVRHAQSRYLIESKHVLNQAIPNHDSSHKTGVPARFEYRHGFQTYILLV